MRRLLGGLFFAIAIFLPSAARADAGVLVLGDRSEPDPSRLSLAEMDVDVRIDDQVARVAIRQIFANRSNAVLEGQWIFGLPAGATVSNFAVWDDLVRVPGVILERRRARRIYEEVRARSIDPGLLQQGDGGADEARRGAPFSARVAPIPAHGFKRVEVAYHERLPVEDLRSRFALPLRPEAYQAQTAGRFTLRIEVLSTHPIRDFRSVGSAFPLEIVERGPRRVTARFAGRDVTFSEDAAIEYELDAAAGHSLRVLAFRDPNPGEPHPTAWKRPTSEGPPPGYFLASALLAPPEILPPAGPALVGPPSAPAGGSPRTVLALFDTSVSMQWDKLERSYRGLETLLARLRPTDRFNVAMFDEELVPFAPAPVVADRAASERALEFVRSGLIRRGTDLEAALDWGLQQAAAGVGERYVVLFSDGGATRGRIANARLAESFERRRERTPAEQRPRLFAFAVGDDANLALLERLTDGGVLEHVRSTEPIDFKLNAFLSKLGRAPLDDLRLESDPAARLDMIYPLQRTNFTGSIAAWVGRFLEPDSSVRLRLVGDAVDVAATFTPPRADLAHPDVARLWARARVDALLAKIERDGEDEESIAEIIAWSKKFNFVTPYTSFLAAPRSLLRPRVIRPGDPILRVRADESIVSVTALFPFGLIKPLRHLEREDVWQTRFLAPKDMPDGAHEVRLLLRDREGRVYRETKTFLIASKPPEIRVYLDGKKFRRGERVELKVGASRSTRVLTARLIGAAPVSLRWNAAARANTGVLLVPEDLPAGEYPLRFTAEDFAHNIAVEEVRVAVLP